MNVLVIGSGGREHAIGWKLEQSPRVNKVFYAPGNGGTPAQMNTGINPLDTEALVAFARDSGIEMTVVGPEAPLQNGAVDAFRAEGLRIFGPDKRSAQLECSKAYAKAFMQKYAIPTADYAVFDNAGEALDYIRNKSVPVWLKADGLAAGKGAVYCPDETQAKQTLDAMMCDRVFGDAGARVVVEECLSGPEVTLLCFCDGKTIVPMESASDYKRAKDGDEGDNTGGMGCVSPSFYYPQDPSAVSDIVDKTLAGIQAEGLDYRGVLYIGLMMTPHGPKVIEYNARFGDPETQVILPRMETDLLDIIYAAEERRLHEINIRWKPQKAVCVVVASGGYPGEYATGYPITLPGETNGSIIFHAGTKRSGPDGSLGFEGQLLTNGGRVLGVTALADHFLQARSLAYETVSQIRFKDCYYRKDIADCPKL